MDISISNVEKDSRLAAFGNEIQPIQEAVHALVIDSPEKEGLAAEMLSQVKTKGKELAALEKSFVDGPKAFVKMVSTFFRPKADAIEKLELAIKGKMVSYRNELERQEAAARLKAEAAQHKREQAAAKAGRPAPIAPPAPVIVQPSTVRAASGSVTFRLVKKWRIVDPAMIPDRYWVLDEVQIGKESRAGVAIPGVELYEEKEVSGRT